MSTMMKKTTSEQKSNNNNRMEIWSRRSYIQTRLTLLNLLLLTVVSIHTYWFAISAIDNNSPCPFSSSNAEADAINPPNLHDIKSHTATNNSDDDAQQQQQQQPQQLNLSSPQQLLLQQPTPAITTTSSSNNIHHHTHTRLEDAKDGRQFLGAIAVFSAFDWVLQPPYYQSHLTYRNFIRNTWMNHPACSDGRFLCYFIVGSEPMTGSSWRQIPEKYKDDKQPFRLDLNHNSSQANKELSKLLELEMKEYGDILLLPGKDHYNFGKANEWWKWIADMERQNIFSAKYHWKADAESYLHIDNLLNLFENNMNHPKHERVLVGNMKQWRDGKPYRLRPNDKKQTQLPKLEWAMGWGYGLSNRLVHDIQQCIDTHKQANDTLRLYNKGEHEDVFVGIVIKLCELKVVRQQAQKKVISMVELLAKGCPSNLTQDVIAIHCGGEFVAKAFQPIPEEIFKRLHDIYYPSSATTSSSIFEMLQQRQYDRHDQLQQKAQQQRQLASSSSSSSSTSIKWAALWHYFMKIHGVCDNRKGHPYCGGENGMKECLA